MLEIRVLAPNFSRNICLSSNSITTPIQFSDSLDSNTEGSTVDSNYYPCLKAQDQAMRQSYREAKDQQIRYLLLESLAECQTGFIDLTHGAHIKRIISLDVSLVFMMAICTSLQLVVIFATMNSIIR